MRLHLKKCPLQIVCKHEFHDINVVRDAILEVYLQPITQIRILHVNQSIACDI